MNPTPHIFVVGPGASGTSLLMRILQLCGADLGAACGSLLELDSVRAAMRRIAERCSENPSRPYLYSLPEVEALHEEFGVLPQCAKMMHATTLGRRLAEAYPSAHWIRPERHLQRAAESVQRRFWAAAPIDECLAWINYVKSCSDEIEEAACSQYHRIDIERVVKGQYAELHEVIAGVGLHWCGDSRVDAIVDPSRWHGQEEK